MQLTIKSEQELVKIVSQHFEAPYSYQACLLVLESLAIKQSRGILTKDNKKLVAKLEVLNEAQVQ